MDDQNGHMLVSVMINGTLYQKNLLDELEININDLSLTLFDQAQKFAWWGSLRALARDKVLRSEAHLIKIESEGMLREIEGRSSLSNDKMLAKIRSYPLYLRGKEETLQAKRELEIIQNAVTAFEHRKDAIMAMLSINAEASSLDTFKLSKKLRDM
jgi:hypothetical protein